MHSKANSFSLESQASVIFIKKILIFFWSTSLEEFIFTVTLRDTNVNLLISISLKKQANTLDNTRKSVYYETHTKHRKRISTTILNVYVPAITKNEHIFI